MLIARNPDQEFGKTETAFPGEGFLSAHVGEARIDEIFHLGLGGIAYADPERTWALSIYAHYEMYASQMGRNYTLGDGLPFEWSATAAEVTQRVRAAMDD